MSVKLTQRCFFLSAQAMLQQHRATWSSVFAQASLRERFYHTVHAEHAFLWGLVAFEGKSNIAHFSWRERPQLIDFQACETKRPALRGRGITACLTKITMVEQNQWV